MNPVNKKQKHRLPLGIFILIVGIAGMLAVIGISAFTLHFGSFSFLQDANRETPHLTVAEISLEAPDVTVSTPMPIQEKPSDTTPEPETTADNHITISTYATLRFGDENSSVEALNARLMELGYADSDEVSSAFNTSTENAVKLFQRANDLEQTGVATNELQELLYEADAQNYLIKINDDGADVKAAQQRLSDLGYYTDKVSGFYGPQTEMAVRMFQNKNKMSVDGTIDRDVYGILYSEDAEPLYTPSPTPTDTPAPTPKSNSGSKSGSKSSGNSGSKSTEATATPKVTNKPGAEKSSYGSGISGMIDCAMTQVGDPYVYGAEGPDSFDCSGFVYYCMKSAGFSVSRRSSSSYAANDSWKKIEKISDLKKGDLIFWKSDTNDKVSHVGISLGGSSFVHASYSAGKVLVSYFGGSSSYWTRNFVCGRRFA